MSYGSMILPVSREQGGSSSGGDPREPWVKLEQVKPKEINKGLGMAMLHHMWFNAATGNSAAHMQFLGCPIEVRGDNVHIFLDFWAWPYDPNLVFTLEASQGTVGNRRPAREQREFSVFVNHETVVLLPYYMEWVTVRWLTPTYNTDGEIVLSPTIIVHNTWLELNAEVFGVVRVRGYAIGELATCEIVLNKPIEDTPITTADAAGWADAGGKVILTPPPTTSQNSLKISNVKTTITASWVVCVDNEEDNNYVGMPEDGIVCLEALRFARLPLEIPPCVEEFLKLCPEMYQLITRICTEQHTLTVYYDACRGKVMRLVPTNPVAYCSQTVSQLPPGMPAPRITAGSGWLR